VLPETKEQLTNQDRFNELLLIGLRTVWGVDKSELFQCLEPSSEWFTILNKYLSAEKVLETSTHYQLTQKGKLLADAIASDLFIIDQ
ncbi:MAG: coproporphyrinogen III oxidase, partial [Fluviicola sp.]|nr:coproporphyrinogen III oxidase [Fluviicola sp.]